MHRLSLPGICKDIALLSSVTHEADLRGALPERSLIILDESLQQQDETRRLIHLLTAGKPFILKAIPASSYAQKPSFAENFLEELKNDGTEYGGILAIGGSTVLNLADYIAYGLSDQNKKEFPHYIVPSTLLALRAQHDPNAIVFSPYILETLPDDELKRDLAESLRHALLQDYAYPGHGNDWISFDDASLLMGQEHPDRTLVSTEALMTLYAKAQIMQMGKTAKAEANLLLSYGLLHAHALEMATDYTVPPGDSAVFGMLVDLKLAGDKELYKKILKLTPSLPLSKTFETLSFDENKLRAAYKAETRPFFRAALNDTGHNPGFEILPLESIGQYFDPKPEDIHPKIFRLEQIIIATRDVHADIERHIQRSTFTRPKKSVFPL